MTPPPIFRRILFPAVCALLTGCMKQPTPPEATPAAPVVWQKPPNVAPEEWVELVGSTQPPPGASGRVTAAVEGRVDSLLVVKNAEGKVVKQLHEGDEVEQGQPIVYLDDRLVRLNRDKAQSAISTAEQEVSQAQTASNLADANLASQVALQKKDATLVPELQLKSYQAAAQDARSKLLAARQRQDQAKKDLETLDAQIGLYVLKAPIKGRLGRVQASVGQTLSAGADVAEVVNVEEQIDVLCFVSQRDAARLKAGQPANLGGFDARPGDVRTTDLGGEVVYVSDKAELETGCFAVKVRFPNKETRLRGNVVERVRVQVLNGEQAAALVGDQGVCLQEDWLIEDHDPPTVIVVEDVKEGKDDEGKPQETGTARRLSALVAVRDRENKVVGVRGLVDEDGKEYKADLKEVRFVTEGAQGLATGDPVRLQAKEKG